MDRGCRFRRFQHCFLPLRFISLNDGKAFLTALPREQMTPPSNMSCTRQTVLGQCRNSNSIGCYNCELTNCSHVWTAVLVITSALVALSIIIAVMTYRQIVRPLEQLEKVASTVRETKNYDVRVNDASANEIGRVASAFDGMLAELAAARDRERLEQSELAKVTRLTTMGVMAASIAHEINQPLAAIVSSGNVGCVGFRVVHPIWPRCAIS